ncbi:MAG TPA: hypothetical protein VFO65_06480 [Acidimicrobiales bacterium]|nr:hypothetical protein [Acidimicrobiales bacterium]
MTDVVVALGAAVVGVAAVVWGAETFAAHLARAAAGLGVSAFALALLLAGAEPEELATAVTAARRGAPALALGDVVGANVTACLLALGAGALVAPLPFGPRVRRYGLLALPAGAVAVATAWDGHVGRPEGALLVTLYAAYVTAIWVAERRPPAIGEVEEVEEAVAEVAAGGRAGRRVGRDLGLVVAGVAAMVVGSVLLVEGVLELAPAEADQARVSLTVVGLATGFELVVLAWSSARRGVSEAVVAAVVGSYAYNATMTLGAAALARPLDLDEPAAFHPPLVAMLVALVVALALARPGRVLGRRRGAALLAAYPLFVVIALLR